MEVIIDKTISIDNTNKIADIHYKIQSIKLNYMILCVPLDVFNHDEENEIDLLCINQMKTEITNKNVDVTNWDFVFNKTVIRKNKDNIES